jgi:hypothetical protein
MLTSYMVKCPNPDCAWFGSLLPHSEPDAWRGPVPAADTVEFRCPQCHGEWHARIVGDDVMPLEAVPAHLV